MARTSKKAGTVSRQGNGGAAPAATLDSAVDIGNPFGAQWARDAFGASLGQARNLFDCMQALQQVQARALLDAAGDVDRALEALEDAEDAGALAAVPGHLLNAQWQHALEHTGEAATRLFELESAWLAQMQAQGARQLAALGKGGNGAGAAGNVAGAGSGGGVVEGTNVPWQQWLDQWQHGVADLSRAWNDALRAVQPRV